MALTYGDRLILDEANRDAADNWNPETDGTETDQTPCGFCGEAVEDSAEWWGDMIVCGSCYRKRLPGYRAALAAR